MSVVGIVLPDNAKRGAQGSLEPGGPAAAAAFNWPNYLKKTKSVAAPAECFHQPLNPSPNGFREGMLICALDPVLKFLSPAVILDVCGYRICFEFFDTRYATEYWRTIDDENIHPLTYSLDCRGELKEDAASAKDAESGAYLYSFKLTCPSDYKNDPAKFQSQLPRYLKSGEHAAADLFVAQKPETPSENKFKLGQKLEAVHVENPEEMFVATIVGVYGDFITVHFDGFPMSDDRQLHFASREIFPVGFAAKTNQLLRVGSPKDDPPKTGTSGSKLLSIAAIAAKLKQKNNDLSSAVPPKKIKRSMSVSGTVASLPAKLFKQHGKPPKAANAVVPQVVGRRSPEFDTISVDGQVTSPPPPAVIPKLIYAKKTGTPGGGIKAEVLEKFQAGLARRQQQEREMQKRTEARGRNVAGASRVVSSVMVKRCAGGADIPFVMNRGESSGRGRRNASPVMMVDLVQEPAFKITGLKMNVVYYVKKTCELGPFLDPELVGRMPSQFGPASIMHVMWEILQSLMNVVIDEYRVEAMEIIPSARELGPMTICVDIEHLGESRIRQLPVYNAADEGLAMKQVTEMLRQLGCCENFITRVENFRCCNGV